MKWRKQAISFWVLALVAFALEIIAWPQRLTPKLPETLSDSAKLKLCLLEAFPVLNLKDYDDYLKRFSPSHLIQDINIAYDKHPPTLIPNPPSSDFSLPVARLDYAFPASTKAFPRVDSNTVSTILSDEYAPGKFGAKAIAFVDTDNKRKIVWWPSANPNSLAYRYVHHRDVVASIVYHMADDLAEGGQIDRAIAYQSFAYAIGSGRRSEDYPLSFLEDFQGFQITAEQVPGPNKKSERKVTYLDVSSSITAAQAKGKSGFYPNDKTLNAKTSENFLNKLIENIDVAYQSINADVLALKAIRVMDIDQLPLTESDKKILVETIQKRYALPLLGSTSETSYPSKRR